MNMTIHSFLWSCLALLRTTARYSILFLFLSLSIASHRNGNGCGCDSATKAELRTKTTTRTKQARQNKRGEEKETKQERHDGWSRMGLKDCLVPFQTVFVCGRCSVSSQLPTKAVRILKSWLSIVWPVLYGLVGRLPPSWLRMRCPAWSHVHGFGGMGGEFGFGTAEGGEAEAINHHPASEHDRRDTGRKERRQWQKRRSNQHRSYDST